MAPTPSTSRVTTGGTSSRAPPPGGDALDALAAFYRPHAAEWGRVARPSATLIVWGTPIGLTRVVPVVEAAGGRWRLRSWLTWAKAIRGNVDHTTLRGFATNSEAAVLFTRDEVDDRAAVDMWNTYTPGHPSRLALEAARVAAGLSVRGVADALGVSAGLARHWFAASQWCLPGARHWPALTRLLPGLPPRDALEALHGPIFAAWRAAVDARRAYFDASAVYPASDWFTDAPPRGAGRTHPTQKPLPLWERLIRATVPPAGWAGRRAPGLVVEPFGGSTRAAVACEGFAPEQARRYVVVERNRAHLDAALAPRAAGAGPGEG